MNFFFFGFFSLQKPINPHFRSFHQFPFRLNCHSFGLFRLFRDETLCRLARHAFYSIFSALSRTVRFQNFQLDFKCSSAHKFRAWVCNVADVSTSLRRFLPKSISPPNTNQQPWRSPRNYLTMHTYCAFTCMNELYTSCCIRERRPGRVGTRVGRMRLSSWKGHVGSLMGGFGRRGGNSPG